MMINHIRIVDISERVQIQHLLFYLELVDRECRKGRKL